MHPLVKAMIGVMLIVASVYYIFAGIPGILRPAAADVLTVLNGAIPLFFVFLGILIVWLEWDEWRIEKELQKEEEELEKKERRSRRKK